MVLSRQSRGRLLVLFGVLWTTPDALLIRLTHCDGITLTFWRQLFSAISVALVCLGLYGWQVIVHSFRTVWPHIIAASLIWAVSTSCFSLAITEAPAAAVLVIISANPLVAAILARVLLHETLDKVTMAAIVCGVGAIALVFAWDVASAGWLGYLLAGVCAITLPLYMVYVQGLSKRYGRITMLPAVSVAGLLWIPIGALALGAQPGTPSAHDFLFFALQGLVLCPVAYAVFTVGPSMVPAAEVALVMLLETLLGPVWVWAALGEQPPRGTVAGGSVLVATLALHAAWRVHQAHMSKDGAAQGEAAADSGLGAPSPIAADEEREAMELTSKDGETETAVEAEGSTAPQGDGDADGAEADQMETPLLP